MKRSSSREQGARAARKVSIRQQVPAGVVDSGLASAATFAIGIYAFRYFSATELGIYAVFFSAFQLASGVSTNFVFIASRIQLLGLTPRRRIGAYGQTLKVSLAPAFIASLLTLVAVPIGSSRVGPGFLTSMAVTVVLTAFLSPVQDHMRALFHLGQVSSAAAVTSLVQAGTVGLVLVLMLVADVEAEWAPFGALAVANLASLSTAVLLARHFGEVAPPALLRITELARSGRWLLSKSVLNTGSDLVARWVVIALSSASVMGVAEGARIAARPLGVFVTGLAAVLLPRAMKAGREGDRQIGKKLERYSNIAVVAVATGYMLFAGASWSGNVIANLAPIGYTVVGLVPFTIVATALSGLLFAETGQIMGAGRERALASTEAVAAVLTVVAALTAGVIGPFAIPLGMLFLAATRLVGYHRSLAEHYRQVELTETPS
jgi:O-antigen/teichoic acid export membrane protein